MSASEVEALVAPETLKEWLDAGENVRVLDCSSHFPFTERSSRREYERQHIPEALFFNIGDCSDVTTGLLHMIPDQMAFEEYVESRGIDNDTHVVVYDTSELGMFSCQRVWWTFRYFGHEKVSILNGGLLRWLALGYPTTWEDTIVEKKRFYARVQHFRLAHFEDVEANLETGQFQVVDARPSGRFKGSDPEPRAGIESGHIPHSKNLPFRLIMDQEKCTVKSKRKLLQLFKDTDVDLNKPLIATCGSGVSACGVALAAFLCGKDDVKIYTGSWTEWYLRARKENIVKSSL